MLVKIAFKVGKGAAILLIWLILTGLLYNLVPVMELAKNTHGIVRYISLFLILGAWWAFIFLWQIMNHYIKEVL